MRRMLRYLGIGLAVLLVLLVIAGGAVYALSTQKMNEKFDVEIEGNLTIPTDDDSIARGKYLVEAVALCQDCHGDNLGGKAFIDDPVMAVLDTPNLTSGEGGIGATFTDEDWIRVLRYGVDSEGHSLIIMPSYH
ncbi:MAG: cytochrome C, partial [Anaerolineae bacterium]|nr:cytochrome C [Anaerolineae bacterium]